MFVRVSLLAAVAALSLCGAASAAVIRDLGRAPASTTVRVAIVLNYQHEGELDTLVDGQADPGSPLYHHFLTPANFRAYFAPAAAEYGRVVASLRSGGFAITHTFANRTVIDAAAPAPVAARFFSTDIHRVLSADAGNTYANVTVPVVPAQIRSLVLAVVGLDASHRVHPQYRFSALAHRIAGVPNARKAGAVFGPDGGYGPQAYINAYDFPTGSGTVGTGRASGVATDSDFLDGDLSSFLSYFGINRTGPATQRVLVDGGPPPGLDDDSVETTLDVEQIVSLAPGTALYVYEAPLDEPTNGNFIDIYNQVVQDAFVDTLNSSYTYCETAIDQVIHGYTRSVEHVEKQGSAEGITFHSAAGDSGSNSPGCDGVSVGEPVDTPHNIAVGGTTLSVNGQGQETAEVGWSYGTGGGVSTIFKVPNFQKKVSTIVAGGRNIPDLAFNADPGTGGSFYFGGGWAGPIGGTSMASPIFGASMTAIDQIQNARAGHFNVALYKTWLAKGYGSGSGLLFRDITEGTIPPFGAGPGYDQMTGIGTMQVSHFAAALKH